MFINNIKELSKKDISTVGGKGASLGEMTQIGIPVPPGFVVLSAAKKEAAEKPCQRQAGEGGPRSTNASHLTTG